MKKQVVVIAGPSGSGKNSIINELLDTFSGSQKLVTAATRKKREQEVDGFDHIFISNNEFNKGIADGLIPEYQYRKDRDVYYGVYLPKLQEQLSAGGLLLGELQIIGARYLKEHFDAVTIFIKPDSFDELERRIRSRSNLPESEIQSRLDIARHEIEIEAPFYDYTITNSNGSLDKAVSSVIKILRQEGITLGS